MRRKICMTLLPVFILVLLSSCYDAREITSYTYVTVFGIDKGISDKWRLTVQYRSVSQNSMSGLSGGSNSESGFHYQTETIDAPSFFSAVNLINTNIPRKLNFEHTKLVVLSEEIAKSGLIGEFIAPLVRYREIRRTTNIVVSEGSAHDFVENFKQHIGLTITKTIEDMVRESKDTGYFPAVNLNDFYSAMKDTVGQPVAVLGAVNSFENFKEDGGKWGDKFNLSGDYYAGDTPRKDGNKVEFLGGAIFNGDKMVGKLTGYESRMLLTITGKLNKAIFTIQDPKVPQYIVPIETIQSSKPEVNVKFLNGKPVISLKVNLKGEILAIQSRVDYESVELKPILEGAAEQYIKEGIERTIEKCRELSCDIFYFGSVAVKQFGTIEEWENYNWNSKFKDVQVNVNVKYTIRLSGTMMENSSINFSEARE